MTEIQAAIGRLQLKKLPAWQRFDFNIRSKFGKLQVRQVTCIAKLKASSL